MCSHNKIIAQNTNTVLSKLKKLNTSFNIFRVIPLHTYLKPLTYSIMSIIRSSLFKTTQDMVNSYRKVSKPEQITFSPNEIEKS